MNAASSERVPSGNRLSSTTEPPKGLGPTGIDPARVERLAINLRAYAYAMGAPRRDNDEEVALGAARLILSALEAKS